MELTPRVANPIDRWIHIWRIRLKLQWRAWKELTVNLLHHKTAMLGGIVILIYILAGIFAPLITIYDPTQGDLRHFLRPPAWQEGGSVDYLLGTDAQGRDILTRIIYGARTSLVVGGLTVTISMLLGGTLGSFAGYFRGRFDAVISRLADLLLAFPFLIFAIGVMAFMGAGFTNLIMALTFKGWVEFFRLVRGEMMAEKTQEYVEAAKVSGLGHFATIVKEIVPNIVQTVFVLGTLRIGDMIIAEASLSFLGLGIPPHIPAWGSMVAAGRDYLLVAWWVSTFPGIALLILVLSVNLLGEGLRDILDPRLKLEG